MKTNHSFDENKAKQLILYLASKVDVGKTKLMKLLYLIDFIAYEKRGKPITNDVYEHWDLGPVPRNIWKNFKEMTSDILEQKAEDRNTGKYHKLIPKITPNLAIFTKTEREVIDSVIEEYGNLYQRELVQIVHKELPYRVTQKNEVIPYHLAPYRNYRRLTKSQLAKLRANKAYIKRLREAYRAFKAEKSERAIA
jgi:uncharacterized phage-associated protein